jgi:predicted alpha/beta hydrolase
MKIEHVKLRDFGNASLTGTYFTSEIAEPRGMILVGCAMGITQKYYRNLAEFLAENGYEVLTFDFRGTGSSAPAKLKNYNVDLMDWANDLGSALEYLRTRNQGLKLTFIGHSISSQLVGFVSQNKYIDKMIFLASSTGYWKEGKSDRWKNLFLLSVVMPFSIFVWGFTNAKFFGQGENYPKGVSLQWRRWCFNPRYLEIDQNESNNYFSQYTNPLLSLYFADDTIANEVTAQRLISLYPDAKKLLIKISPQDFKAKKIGHSGFLSRKFRDSLWPEILKLL